MLNSKDFGVPKNRERVFIIGHSRKKGTRLLFPFRREGQATNSETLKALGNLNTSRSGMSGKVYYSEGLAPTLVRGKGEGFKVAIPCMTPDRLEKRQNGRRFKENQEPMFTLNTQDRHRLYQKIRHYKMEQRMPQSPWVERIVQVLDLDYEDLFRR